MSCIIASVLLSASSLAALIRRAQLLHELRAVLLECARGLVDLALDARIIVLRVEVARRAARLVVFVSIVVRASCLLGGGRCLTSVSC